MAWLGSPSRCGTTVGRGSAPGQQPDIGREWPRVGQGRARPARHDHNSAQRPHPRPFRNRRDGAMVPARQLGRSVTAVSLPVWRQALPRCRRVGIHTAGRHWWGLPSLTGFSGSRTFGRRNSLAAFRLQPAGDSLSFTRNCRSVRPHGQFRGPGRRVLHSC